MAERQFNLIRNRDQDDESTNVTLPERPNRPKHGIKIATRKKVEKTRFQKFKDSFFGDNLIGIDHYVIQDLIIPSIQDCILMFVEAVLRGDRRSVSIRSIGSNSSKTDYNRLSSNRPKTERASRRDDELEQKIRERKALNLDSLVFATRAEANECLIAMMEYLDEYDKVPVAYLYELLGETGDYTTEYWGWRNLKRAGIRSDRGGYALELPRPVQFSRDEL